MFLCKRAQQALPVSERIMSARFRAQPIDISVIQIYAPTADSSDEEVEAFYLQFIIIIIDHHLLCTAAKGWIRTMNNTHSHPPTHSHKYASIQ